MLSLVFLLHFLVLWYQWCLHLSYLRLNGYFNLSLMLVSPILCCPLAHFVIKLGLMPSLHTLVPVHDSGPFLQFLWALPVSRQEFVCSLWYWLGIPIFSSTDSVHCSCGSAVDQFGDHLLGCGHDPMRICRHDVLCDVIFMLSFKITVVVSGNSIVALIWIAQGMFFALTICMVSLLTLM